MCQIFSCQRTARRASRRHTATTKTKNQNLLAASARETAPALRFGPETRNGAERDRTADPLLAKQVLSQLSYSPARDQKLDNATAERLTNKKSKPTASQPRRGNTRLRCASRRGRGMVGLPGVEPGTSRLSGVRSNHLSYRPPVRSAGALHGRRGTLQQATQFETSIGCRMGSGHRPRDVT